MASRMKVCPWEGLLFVDDVPGDANLPCRCPLKMTIWCLRMVTRIIVAMIAYTALPRVFMLPFAILYQETSFPLQRYSAARLVFPLWKKNVKRIGKVTQACGEKFGWRGNLLLRRKTYLISRCRCTVIHAFKMIAITNTKRKSAEP